MFFKKLFLLKIFLLFASTNIALATSSNSDSQIDSKLSFCKITLEALHSELRELRTKQWNDRRSITRVQRQILDTSSPSEIMDMAKSSDSTIFVLSANLVAYSCIAALCTDSGQTEDCPIFTHYSCGKMWCPR